MTMIASTAVKGRILKVRFGELVAKVGGIEAAASLTRVGKSAIARYASLNPAEAECFAPVDIVRDLEAVAGEAIVTAALCTMADGTFVALPDAPATREDLLTLLARQAKEQSDTTAAICAGLADGKLDAADAEKILAELDQLIRVSAHMRAELLTIMKGDQ